MSQKSALNFKLNTENSSNVASPFWTKPETKKSKAKKILKFIWKWSKLLLFAFFMLMGLWGCFQSMGDNTVSTDVNIGSGLEFGFNFGTTGNWIYDLSSGSLYGQFHTFSDWSLDYGPFYAFFVWPGSWLVLQIMWATNSWIGGLNALLAIFILLTIIRIFSILVTLRSTLQNEKMTEVQGKMSEINAKYKGLTDQASKQKKQQEIMDLYKKNNVKPFAAFEQMFITLPIFLIIYRVVTIVRPFKSTILFGIWNFAYTPMSQIFSNFASGGWVYIFFIAIVIPIQFLSMKLPQRWAKKRNRNAVSSSSKGGKQKKKMNMPQNIFAAIMSLIVVFSATGVGVYWFFNALYSILQSWIMHKVIMHSRSKNSSLESKLNRLILE